MAVKQKSQKEITTHIYALDLKKIYQAYQSQKQTDAEQNKFESLKVFIKLYCDNENIQFEKSLAINVLPKQKLKESNEVYLKFLELYLCVIEVKIITNFLDYQLKQFVNKNGKVRFIASINNVVLPSINIDSTPEGILRLNEIKKWQENSEGKYKSQLKEPVTKRFIVKREDGPLISKISEGLFERNVTFNKTDFNKMIISGQPIFINLENALIFAFVIKQLHEKYKKITVEGAKKGAYFIVLSSLLKSSNGSTYDPKYIHNHINEKKKKNPKLITDAEEEADVIISHFGAGLINPNNQKPD